MVYTFFNLLTKTKKDIVNTTPTSSTVLCKFLFCSFAGYMMSLELGILQSLVNLYFGFKTLLLAYVKYVISLWFSSRIIWM